MSDRAVVGGLVAWVAMLTASLLTTSAHGKDPDAGDPKGRDSILDWNAVALAAVAEDHSGTYGTPDQGGPTRSSRALAIIHVAMFDAANSVSPTAEPYLVSHVDNSASLDAAVAAAAADTLTALYPKQARVFALALQRYLPPIKSVPAQKKGLAVGHDIASKLLFIRSHDGSDNPSSYTPSGRPGTHDVDPLNPSQGFLGPAWGQVVPFAVDGHFHFVPRLPPALDSAEYAEALHDVERFGGVGGRITPTDRTVEQTEIALYWAYDGTKKLGTPMRLFNQIVRTIALQEHNTELENARLFALVNLAQADGKILCWGVKYQDILWRPILGIRRADEDGNLDTVADRHWTPLGAPASNRSGNNFTPPFPSYTSGHATCAGAVFRVLERFYGTDDISFTFVSDELNGVTTDSLGRVRPKRPRTFHSFSQAAAECGRSRIYLGIHWQFDCDEGLRCGYAVADQVVDTVLRRQNNGDNGNHGGNGNHD